jgi:hypothetical protein
MTNTTFDATTKPSIPIQFHTIHTSNNGTIKSNPAQRIHRLRRSPNLLHPHIGLDNTIKSPTIAPPLCFCSSAPHSQQTTHHTLPPPQLHRRSSTSRNSFSRRSTRLPRRKRTPHFPKTCLGAVAHETRGMQKTEKTLRKEERRGTDKSGINRFKMLVEVVEACTLWTLCLQSSRACR